MAEPVVPAPAPVTPPPAPVTPPPAEPAKPAEPTPAPAPKAPGSLLTDPTPAEGDKKPDGKPADDSSKKPEGDKKPDEKFELKLPEGSLLDSKRLDETVSFAKEQGLSPKVAQALLDRESAAMAAFVEKNEVAFEERAAAWAKELPNDKEFGGEAFKQNTELAKRVITKFGSNALKAELEKGFGNHPELVRIFVKIGKEFGEDRLVLPGAQPARKKTMEEKFYPELAKQGAN